MKKLEEKKNKFSECVHCEKFFECEIKKNKPDQCLYFKERKE